MKLSPEIENCFQEWKADPLAFLRSLKLQSCPLAADLYDRAQMPTHTAADKILWRFLTTTCFDIVQSVSSSTRYAASKDGLSFVVAAICESSARDSSAVSKGVMELVHYGRRYRTLADQMGDTGCFFFFPNISEWM